jgi:hypothetical protein
MKKPGDPGYELLQAANDAIVSFMHHDGDLSDLKEAIMFLEEYIKPIEDLKRKEEEKFLGEFWKGMFTGKL